MPSAFFTVNGSSQIIAHEAAYSSTVNLALTSLTGIQSIAWSIASTSKADLAAPVITPAGSPTGATASFTMPSDPGDDLGRAFIVQCTVSGGGQTATHRAVVGKANINDTVPICVDEALERNATHGWAEEMNELLAATAGGGGPVTFPLEADHGDTVLTGEINAGGSDADLIRWGASTDFLTFGDNTLVDGMDFRVQSGASYKWYVNNGEIVELTATDLDLQSCGLILGGDVQHGSSPASVGDLRVSTGWYANARNDAGNADVLLLGWGVGSPDVLEIGEVGVAGMAFGVATGGGYTWRVNGAEVAFFDDTHFDLESLVLRQGTQVAGTGSYRVGASWSLVGLNETLSADRAILTYGSGTVTVGGTTADTSILRGTTSAIINVNGTALLSFDTTTADFGTAIIEQGSTPASAGDFRTKSAWVLAARNNANNADVDLLQKTSGDLIVLGDSTDASGVEIKAKTGTTVIIDIAGTDEYSFSATALDLGSNNLTTTGNLQVRSGASSAASGDLRFGDGATVTWFSSSTRTALTLSGEVSTLGNGSTVRQRYESVDFHQFYVQGTSRFIAGNTSLEHNPGSAATWKILESASTGTGTALSIIGQDRSASTSTNVGGALTVRAGNATGATATHTGGLLTLQGGDATGGSGTRTGGGLDLRAGTGATANGELRLLDNTTPRVRIDGTGLAFYNTAPIAKPTVSGAKGSNAALGSLMTALSNLGLVTDSTSA